MVLIDATFNTVYVKYGQIVKSFTSGHAMEDISPVYISIPK